MTTAPARLTDSSATPTLNDAGSRTEYLLDVAAQTFLELGYEGTSVGEIARRARASKETFYNKYNNKSDLFRTVMGRIMDRFAHQLGSTLEAAATPELILETFGTLLLDRVLSEEGIAMQKIVYMEARRFPEVAKVFFELGPQRTTSALARYFKSQVKKGTLKVPDAELAAGHFIGLITSELIMRKSLGIFDTPSAKDKAYKIKSAVSVFLRAYSA